MMKTFINFGSRKSCQTVVAIFILGFLISSCGTTVKKQSAVKAEPSAVQSFAKIKSAVGVSTDSEVVRSLIDFVKLNPGLDITSDAYLLMGDIYFKHKKYAEALKAYSNIVNSQSFSPHFDQARIKVAYCYAFLNEERKAYDLIRDVLANSKLNEADSASALKLKADLNNRFGSALEQVETYYNLARSTDNPTLRRQFELKALSAVESRLDETDLLKVSKMSSLSTLQLTAVFRLGLINFERGDHGQAESYLSQAKSMDPEGAYGERADEILKQIYARKTVDSYTIGAVLPLSGPNAAFGYKALKGIQLALGIYDKSGARFKLAVVDSEGSPSIARRAVERLVVEDHAIAIIGSLLSRTAIAVASKAQELRVPNMALSQQSGVTDIGDFIFRNALTSQMQVEFLVRVAMEERGYKRFAILYPNHKYGIEFANLFWDEVLSRGGAITAAQIYEKDETDFGDHVQRLVGTFYVDARADEYRYKLREWKEKNPHMSARKKPPEDLLPPLTPFDALFIPDDAKAIGQIAPMLAYHNVNQVPLMGTNLWNTPDIIKRAGKYLNNSLFVDSYMRSSNGSQTEAFQKKFQNTFESNPSLIEVQAYDAAVLLTNAVNSGAKNRESVREQLVSAKNIEGSLGQMTMMPTREVLRPMTALTVSEGQITVLPPSSKSGL